jgi:hypothetical protein
MYTLMTSYLVGCAIALIVSACSGVAQAAEAAPGSGLAVAAMFTDRMTRAHQPGGRRPGGSLFNGAGLPASPYRADNCPGVGTRANNLIHPE